MDNSAKATLTTHLKRVLQGAVKATGRTQFEPTGQDEIVQVFNKLIQLLAIDLGTGDPTTIPAHTHLITQVIGLQAALNSKATTTQLNDAVAQLEAEIAAIVFGAHAYTHENGGTDEINVAGLSGLLADPQTPAAHSHTQSDVVGLVGDLSGKQPLATILSTLAALANAPGVLTNNGSGGLSWGAGGGGGEGGYAGSMLLMGG